jgi:hypothetical protein
MLRQRALTRRPLIRDANPYILLLKPKTRAKHFTNRPKYGFFTNYNQS